MKNRKSGDAGMKYDPVQVRIHEAYTVAIRDLGVHGEGIGSLDGFTVFVPGALPGETVTAKITLLKKSYALGKLLSIEQESPFRTVPRSSPPSGRPAVPLCWPIRAIIFPGWN